VLQTPTAS